MESVIEELDESSLRNVISFVHSVTGITIPEHKRTMIQRRLQSRLKFHSLTSYKDYIKLAKASDDELTQFINMVTTNETNFFRTDRVWEYFENDYLPEFFKNHPGSTLSAWSAASSTGEEGYSIGMCCEDFKRKQPALFEYKVLGTDISSRVVDHATKGRYKGRSIDNFKIKRKEHCDRFLTASGEEYAISSVLKSRVKFKIHNLFDILAEKEMFDIVFLRNVLIYFSSKDQEIVLRNLDKKMNPGGVLVIGESESLTKLKSNFEFVSPLIYKKKGLS